MNFSGRIHVETLTQLPVLAKWCFRLPLFANVSASATALTLLRNDPTEGRATAREYPQLQPFVKVSAKATAFNIALLLFTVS